MLIRKILYLSIIMAIGPVARTGDMIAIGGDQYVSGFTRS